MILRALRGIAWTGLTVGVVGSMTPAYGQYPTHSNCPPAPCPVAPYAPMPSPAPAGPPQYVPSPSMTPAAPAPSPSAPSAEGAVAPPTTPSFDVASLGAESSVGLGGESAAFANPGGYLDNAIPMTMFRMRYDAGFNMNHPDRAEYFYAEWKEMSFHPHGINGDGVFLTDPKAKGPDQFPGRLDYQEASAYFEVAYNNRFSAFLDVPVRFVDFDNLLEDPDHESKPTNLAPNVGKPFFPEPGPENKPLHNDLAGLSDLVVGAKAAVIAQPDRYLTLQLQTFIPTGDPDRGLGTGHVSLEPDALFYQRLSDSLEFQGQFGIWVPVGGARFSGEILIYGLGLGYVLYNRGDVRVEPITEFVGWTVLDGFESAVQPIIATPTPGLALPHGHGVVDAGGQTIVNAKLGVRTYFGSRSDAYVGYGQALTGDRWYQEIVRVEYRLHF